MVRFAFLVLVSFFSLILGCIYFSGPEHAAALCTEVYFELLWKRTHRWTIGVMPPGTTRVSESRFGSVLACDRMFPAAAPILQTSRRWPTCRSRQRLFPRFPHKQSMLDKHRQADKWMRTRILQTLSFLVARKDKWGHLSSPECRCGRSTSASMS